jgi:hypothetical protein
MDEDRLSPELGRLIDEAKAAARLLGPDTLQAEGVALLTGGGTIHSGAATPGAPPLSAAELAVARAHEAGDEEILAAAVAVPGDAGETVPPSAASHECLLRIDPELPLVVKRQGRWVALPASQVRPCSSR